MLRVYVLIVFVRWPAKSNARAQATLGPDLQKWMGGGIAFVICPLIFTVLFLCLVVAHASQQSLAAVTPFLSGLLVAFVPFLATVPAAVALGWRLDAFYPASRVIEWRSRKSG